jgi:hypothetical protein
MQKNNFIVEHQLEEAEWEKAAKRKICSICDNKSGHKAAVIRNGQLKHLACMMKKGENLTSRKDDIHVGGGK